MLNDRYGIDYGPTRKWGPDASLLDAGAIPGLSEATVMVLGSRKPGQEAIHYPDDNFGPIRK